RPPGPAGRVGMPPGRTWRPCRHQGHRAVQHRPDGVANGRRSPGVLGAMSLTRSLRRTPPRRYRLEDYKRWFGRTGDEMLDNLKSFSPLAPPPVEGKGAIGVVVGPWVHTPAPWYALALAVGLAHRGRPVVILWD